MAQTHFSTCNHDKDEALCLVCERTIRAAIRLDDREQVGDELRHVRTELDAERRANLFQTGDDSQLHGIVLAPSLLQISTLFWTRGHTAMREKMLLMYGFALCPTMEIRDANSLRKN